MLSTLTSEQAILLISTLGPTVLGIVGTLGALAFKALLPKLPSAVRAKVQELANDVVAEVEAKSAGLSGTDKKVKATYRLKAILDGLGIHLSDEVISACIESAVAALNAALPPAPVPSVTLATPQSAP